MRSSRRFHIVHSIGMLLFAASAFCSSSTQTALASRQVVHEGDLVVWTADLPGNRHALAAFNVGEKAITVDRALASCGLAAAQHNVRNAWTGERLKVTSRINMTLEPHASAVLILD